MKDLLLSTLVREFDKYSILKSIILQFLLCDIAEFLNLIVFFIVQFTVWILNFSNKFCEMEMNLNAANYSSTF